MKFEPGDLILSSTTLPQAMKIGLVLEIAHSGYYRIRALTGASFSHTLLLKSSWIDYYYRKANV
jgi:hypothetical protein